MTQTKDNLETAFAGELMANRKYTAYALKAEAEGQAQIARLFRAAAHSETVHALAHFRVLDGIATTAENLQAALSGENYEVDTMYPPFIAAAEEEGEAARRSFDNAFQVEKVHALLYREALEMLLESRSEDAYDYYVCPVCGYTHKRSAPDRCPVCGAPGTRFEVIH